MTRVLVIHRDPPEATERAARFRALGLDATPYLSLGSQGFRSIRQNPPHVILIDLTRLPSYGKAMGVLIRQQKSLCSIPLVFVEGDPEKAAQVRAILPDAVYTAWAKVPAAIRRAIRQAPSEPVPPRVPATPLLAKLGIGENSRVALMHPPDDFELPGVPSKSKLQTPTWCSSSSAAPSRLAANCPNSRVCAQRQACVGTLAEEGIRRVKRPDPGAHSRDGLALGLVDYKVCAVDATWSATTLGKRRADAAKLL